MLAADVVLLQSRDDRLERELLQLDRPQQLVRVDVHPQIAVE